MAELPGILGRGSNASEMQIPVIPPAQGLANRIASSLARFVIALEVHEMECPYDMLGDELAVAALVHGKRRHICSEAETDTDKYKRILDRMTETHIGEGKRSADVVRQTRKVSAYLQHPHPDLKFHYTGAHLVTYHEILMEMEAKFRDDFLIKSLFLRPTKERAGPSITYTHLLHNFHEEFEDALKNGVNPKGIFEAALQRPTNQKAVARFLRKYIFQNSLIDKFVTEIEEFYRIFEKYREFGKSDELTAKNMLDAIGPQDFAVAIYGMGHGLRRNNPASFPDQLVAQAMERGHANVSRELLLLAEPRFARAIHDLIAEFSGQGQLREDITVYDNILQREWPIQEWFEKAPQIYAPSGKVITGLSLTKD